MKRHKNNTPIAAGKSSFDLIEPEKLFAALQIEKDAILLDAACGQAAYALADEQLDGCLLQYCSGLGHTRRQAARRSAGEPQALTVSTPSCSPLMKAIGFLL